MLLFNFDVTASNGSGLIVVLAQDRSDAERLAQLDLQGDFPDYQLEMPNTPKEYRIAGEGLVAYCEMRVQVHGQD